MKKILLLILCCNFFSAFSQDTLQIGSDNFVNTPSSYPAPYGNHFEGARHQFLIQACELVNNGKIMDSILNLAFNVDQAEGEALKDFTIRVGHTTSSELSTWVGGLQTVYFDSSYVDSNGWNFHDFDIPFKYNGNDNLVIEVCFNNSTFTFNAITFMSQTAFNSCVFFRDDASGVCGNSNFDGVVKMRPNMLIGGSTIDVTNDLTAVKILNPTSFCGLGTTEVLSFELFNNGNSAQSGFNVGYSVNGASPVIEFFNGTVQPGTAEPYIFVATADLSASQSELKIWVSLPVDQVLCNDTLVYNVINSNAIDSFPYIEDFDAHGGFLTDLISDSMDWMINSGFTSSGSTGPNGDHTTDTTNYIYTEASFPNNPFKLAIIESPCLKIDTLINPYLEFWYHMYGFDMGTLTVEISDGLNWVKAWERSGDQGVDWKKGKVFIRNFSNDDLVKYRFIGETGAGFASDIALDDIMVFDMPTQHDLATIGVSGLDTGYICLGDNQDSIWVEISNCGTFIEPTYSVSYNLNGGTVNTLTITDSLEQGVSVFLNLGLLNLSGPGSYKLKVWTDVLSDANNLNDTMIYDFIIIPVPSSGLPSDTLICFGDTITLDAGPGFNFYFWGALSTGNTGFSQTFDVNFEDSMIVELTDTFGCIGFDTIITSFIPLPIVDLGNDTTVCISDLITLDAGSGFNSYLWPDGSSLQTYNFTSNVALDTVITVAVTGSNACLAKDSLRLIYIDVLTIDLGVDTNVCPGFTLDAGIGGGTYLWNTGDITQSIVIDTSGSYIVNVNKCGVAGDTINIVVNGFPTLNIGNDTTICVYDSLLLDATVSGAYWYEWDNSDTTPTSYVSKKCIYSLDMYDSSSDDWQGGSIDFYINGNLEGSYSCLNSFTNAQISVEQGDSLSITYLSGSFETENTYELYNGAGNLVFQDGPLPATGIVWSEIASCFTNDYFGVTIVDTLLGCSLRDSIKLNFSAPVVELGNDTSICSGTSLTLMGGSAASYLWSTTSTSQSVSVAAIGPYWLRVTDSVGCVVSDTMEILSLFAAPNVDLGNDTTICSSDQLSLFPSGTYNSYLWSNSNSTSSIFAGAGTWWLVAIDSNGCQGLDTIVISNLNPPTVNIGPDTILCTGDSIVVDAGAGYNTYQWSHGFLTQTAPINSAGTYWVDVSDSIGCVASDTILVSVQSVNFTIDLGNDTVLCSGDSLILKASINNSSASYSWNNLSTSSSIQVGTTGVYSVTVSVCGVSDQDSIDVTIAVNPVVNIGNDTTICDTSNLTLDAGGGFANYAWSTLASTQTVIANSAGTYSVTVVDNNGCTAADAIVINVDSCDVSVGELTSLVKLSFTIYPNPTSNSKLNLTVNSHVNDPSLLLEIYSLRGQLIYSTKIQNQFGQFNKSFQLPRLSSGLYQIRLTSKEVELIEKLIIE